MSECNICCSSFTKSKRQKMQCINCKFECCSQCIKNYILSISTEAKCMNCNIAISILYLYRHFSQKFVVEYRHHRQSILWNRELYHLPTISEYISWKNKEKECYELKKKYNEKYDILDQKIKYTDIRWINKKINSLMQSVCSCISNIKNKDHNMEYYKTKQKKIESMVSSLQKLREKSLSNINENKTIDQWKNEKNEIISLLEEKKCEFYRLERICSLMRQDFIFNTNHTEQYLGKGYLIQKNKEKSYKNRPCITENCKGFLNNKGECPLCKQITCIECNNCKNENHICKKEDIETWNEMKKNTRPCPKCNVRIHKISGCDQMWCINCNTAFSWLKGTIETGSIHNPHYFDWMFNTDTQEIVDEQNDFCNENRLPHQTRLKCFIKKQSNPKSSECQLVIECYRTIQHIKNVEMNRFLISETDIKRNIFEYLYSYLMYDKSPKKNYEILLTKKLKNDEIYNILETYNRHQIHLIRSLIKEKITIDNYLDEYNKYREFYINIIDDYKKIYNFKKKIHI